MTEDEIYAEPAGRKLDALVAEKVFGWRWWRSSATGRRCVYAPGKQARWMDTPADMTEPLVHDWPNIHLPRYSTDVGHAWEVLGRLSPPDGRAPILELKHVWGGPLESHPQYVCNLGHGWAQAETAPLAICRAALLCCLSPSRPLSGPPAPGT